MIASRRTSAQGRLEPDAGTDPVTMISNGALDAVIEGKGFFQVRRPSGELAYTRAGSFHLDRDGNVVTSDGDPLEPQITIPADAQQISIGKDGTVSVVKETSAGKFETVQTLKTFKGAKTIAMDTKKHRALLPCKVPDGKGGETFGIVVVGVKKARN